MSGILVGVDGSDGSPSALRWAAAEAALRSAPLTALHAYPRPWVYAGTDADMATFEPERHRQAREVLERALQQAEADLADLVVERRLSAGGSAPALIGAAAGADLLVVGVRGTGGFKGLRLGSTAEHCARHAPCPVVVVPEGPPRGTGRLVVGVDGSAGGRRALAWAVDEAARRGSSVEVVGVYLPYRAHRPFGAEFMDVASPGWERCFHQATEQVVADALTSVRTPEDVTLRTHVAGGHPAQVLVERACAADLLVVGSRGLHGFPGVALGSVSRQVLHHSSSPVVVVRAPAGRPGS